MVKSIGSVVDENTQILIFRLMGQLSWFETTKSGLIWETYQWPVSLSQKRVDQRALQSVFGSIFRTARLTVVSSPLCDMAPQDSQFIALEGARFS